MSNTRVSSHRLAAVIAAVAALFLGLPSLAHADDDDCRGKRHRHHHRSHYHGDDGYYGRPHWRGPKRVKVYNHYYPVPVPVAVPVAPAYPAYPQDYDAYDSKPVVRIGVDWVIGF